MQDYKQASVMFAARDRGALIFEAFANSPPWFMTISGLPRYDRKLIQYIVTEQARQCSPFRELHVPAHEQIHRK